MVSDGNNRFAALQEPDDEDEHMMTQGDGLDDELFSTDSNFKATS
jgi:hypothetical protein